MTPPFPFIHQQRSDTVNRTIATHDPRGMRDLILNFPKQAEEAVAIGRAASVRINAKKVRAIVVSGLGGSAIGGDLLRAYLSGTCRVPVFVNRHYRFPAFVGPDTLVIVSSYSGNTEETVASYREAVRRKAQVLCITSGGAVLRMAKRYRHPVIVIPGGLPPRAALGYSFFPMLLAVSRLGFVKDQTKAVNETLALLRTLAAEYADHDAPGNAALALARTLHGRLPLIYSGPERFDTVNVRWRGQITENAKTLAFGHVFPELNHNEIVGWEVLQGLMKQMHVVMLRDEEDHPRVQLRMEVTKGIIAPMAAGVTEVRSRGRSLLARMFSLLVLADWLSFYLAMLNGVDPTPVKKIDFLKEALAKVK